MGTSLCDAWIAELRGHELEVEKLSKSLTEMDPGANAGETLRKQKQFTTAQMTRHRISMALLSARIASASGESIGYGD